MIYGTTAASISHTHLTQTTYNFPRFPLTLPTGWHTKWPVRVAASNTSPITTTEDQKKLGELFTAHASHTLLDDTMAET